MGLILHQFSIANGALIQLKIPVIFMNMISSKLSSACALILIILFASFSPIWAREKIAPVISLSDQCGFTVPDKALNEVIYHTQVIRSLSVENSIQWKFLCDIANNAVNESGRYKLRAVMDGYMLYLVDLKPVISSQERALIAKAIGVSAKKVKNQQSALSLIYWDFGNMSAYATIGQPEAESLTYQIRENALEVFEVFDKYDEMWNAD